MRFKLVEWVDQDTGKEYFDYKTGIIKNPPFDVIDTTKTGFSFCDQLIPGNKENDYMKKEKNLVGKIVDMSPTQYYNECANNIFSNTTVGKLKLSREYDKESNSTIKEVITKFKRQIPMPYLDYAKKCQEGLHRMQILGDMYGWDTKFPVLIIDFYDKEREKRFQEYLYQRDVQSTIEDVWNRVTYDEVYPTIEEFMDCLQTELTVRFQSKFDDVELVDGEVPFKLTENDDCYILTVHSVTTSFDKEDLKIDPQHQEEEKEFNIDNELDQLDLDYDDLDIYDLLNK